MIKYSFTKGLGKAAVQLLTVAGALVAFAGFSDLSIWDLIVQYIKPVVGSLTIGGVIALALNWIKIRMKNANGGV